MPEITTSESQPFDYWKELSDSSLTHLKGRVKVHPTQFPVDETEDFHDPFSDLSLFLAKKIRQEIERNGSCREWSTRIENDLMKNILPEFKVKFPRYRLGVFALKKTFEKVAYYYEKLSCKKEAITQEGTVNTSYMIRENLRDLLSHKSPHDFYPHNEAHRIAVRISECIATLDGERPPLEALTHRIWATLKHLISVSKTASIKSPFEQFDERDKLIAKALIEIESQSPSIDFETLCSQIEERLHVYRTLPIQIKNSPLIPLVHSLVAKGFAIKKEIDLPEYEKTLLLAHIHERLSLGQTIPTIIQRLLHLYNLQKEIKAHEHQSLVEHLNLQIWLLEDDESAILKDLAMLQSMTYLNSLSAEDYEIALWAFVENFERQKSSPFWHDLIELEITGQALTLKRPDYKTLCTQTLSFLRKAKETSSDLEGLSQKIELWALQGEMIYHYLHFEATTPFLCALMQESDQSFDSRVNNFLIEHPHLLPYKRAMGVQAKIYESYIWYHAKGSDHESSYDRFIKRHKGCEQLEELVRKKFPLVPFCPHYAQEQIKAGS